MSFARSGVSAKALIAVALLSAARARTPDPQRVAEQFVQAYFVEDDMAGAVKLASGDVKTQLEGQLRQIEATGTKELVKDKPQMKVDLLQMQPGSGDAVGYVYLVRSDVPGIAPITARLGLSKVGETWLVSEFVQTP